MVVSNGTVQQGFHTPDPVLAELVFFQTNVEEFPINWCISSEAYKVGLQRPHPFLPDRGLTILIYWVV